MKLKKRGCVQVQCCVPDLAYQIRRNWLKTKKLKARIFDDDSLRRGPGANIQDSSGYTPLHHAALNGHKEIVRLLLAADASPSLVDQTGASPLHLAAWAGHPEIVRSLLAQNVNPVNIDLATKTKETALHWAAQFGHMDVVSQLLARGADPLLKNAQGERPLDLAAQYGRLETVQHLLHIRPELMQRYRAPAARARIYRNTPLHRASKNGHEQVVEVLLAAGVDVNIRTESGTALHEAALCGKANVVRTLLDHGAEVNMLDGRGRTVQHLLKQYTAPAHKTIRDTIESHRQSNGFESDLDDYPPFPVMDDNSPSYDKSMSLCRRSSSDMDSRIISMPAPETPSVKDHSINKASSSALIKHHSNNFVQKITSKCLGLKAKFNSAPNISKTGLGSEVELRSKEHHSSENRARATNTLHIGNSRFFKILAKKRDEPIDVLCNDEFDTISLDRLITIDRLSLHNRSNRSCPGFKASLPNISENTELSSDSTESIEGSEFSLHVGMSNECVRVAETYNSVVRTSLPYAILETEMEDNVSNLDIKTLLPNSTKTAAAENDLYEAYSSINKAEKVSHINTERNEDNVKPQRRNIIPQKAIDTIYENVTFEYHIEPPKVPTRTALPSENTQGVVREPVYANLSTTLNESVKPVPAKRTLVLCNSNETITSYGSCSETTTSYDSCFTENVDSSIHSSRTSTMSLDSRIDCSNFEDILLSKKSKSFRTPGHVHSQSSQDDEFSDSSSSSSATSSVVGESNSIEDVDCSSDIEPANGDYMSMSRTLPKLNSKPEPNRKLFRNITFSSATAASCGKFKKHANENFVNYHIRGTGHCVYKSPTVQEFIYVFNKDTLKDDDVPPFSKVPNDRESIYGTAICFCRPDEHKHHKSADDLTAVRGDESPKVYVDAESLLKRVAIAASSFRCYCDNGSCSLHHRWREVPDLAVKFHAFNRSVSTPDLTRTDVAAPKPARLEDPYAIVDLSSVRFRHDSISSNDTSLTFGALSEPSTLSSLRRPGSADLRSECSSSTGTLRGSANALNVASLDGGSRGGRGCVRSGSAARRWDEGDVLSEADALSVSSAASSSLPHHLQHHHHHAYNKVSPTPPKKPPRRNLSVSPTHVNSPAVSYDQLRTHARSQDDLDDLQGAKHYLKHGRSVDQYVDSKHSYSECSEENHNSPRLIPVPNPRPSLKHRNQPVAITAMYENVVIKEQNPRRKLRRNFTHQYENFDPAKMTEQRKYSAQQRSSLESLLDDVQSMNSPSDCERYYEGVRVPLSPTHYDQPPTPDHPPPSAKHAENSIHERIRPLSQLIMEVIEEIRLKKALENRKGPHTRDADA